ncbi:MAG: YhbY family RNA-binding protein [Methanobacteriaceae archaeon]
MRRSLNAMALNIGKAGVNDSFIEEIKRQLKEKEIVKLKFSKTVSDEKEELIGEIISKTRSKLVDLRGNVAVIYKKSVK